MARLLVWASAAVVVMALIQVCWSAPAAPAPHTVTSRDTDEDPTLTAKLKRIQELLSKLVPADEESDLQSVADASGHVASKPASQEKEMRSFVAGDRQARQPSKVPAPPKPTSDTDDDSIKMLAAALAHLQQSQTEAPDSDGETLGSSFNPIVKEDRPAIEHGSEVTADLEQTIARALARLQEQDNESSQERAQPAEAAQPNAFQLHGEAVRLVESRLLGDLSLAEQMGISVKDLIQDLEEKASREETLRQLESGLASLVAGRDE